MNLYEYVGDNPLNNIDPTGLVKFPGGDVPEEPKPNDPPTITIPPITIPLPPGPRAPKTPPIKIWIKCPVIKDSKGKIQCQLPIWCEIPLDPDQQKPRH